MCKGGNNILDDTSVGTLTVKWLGKDLMSNFGAKNVRLCKYKK